MGKLVVVAGALTAELLKPNAGGDVVGIFDPNVADAAGFVVFVAAPNVNIDGAPVPIELVAVLAVVLEDNAPNPTFALEARVGFVAGLPKLNVGAAGVV